MIEISMFSNDGCKLSYLSSVVTESEESVALSWKLFHWGEKMMRVETFGGGLTEDVTT